MAITNEPARLIRPPVFSNGDDAVAEPQDQERTEATAPQRQRAPKMLPTDGQTALRNTELAHMNDDYMHNMAVAARQKRNNKFPTQAKKNAALWVFGLGIGSVGAGVGTSRAVHPLHIFAGDELYETVVSTNGRKRPLDDSGTEERRVRAREEQDDHIGRANFGDGNVLWNEVRACCCLCFSVLIAQDVELGRHASPPLHDDNSSQMPWNVTASVQSSRHDAPGNIFRGLGSVSDFSSGREASVGISGIGLGRPRSRLTSASPLAGRGFPYDIDTLSIPGHHDDDLDKLEGFDLSNYLDGDGDLAGIGESHSTAAAARAGPSARSQELQNSLTESVMDQEGLNFLDFLAGKIDSLRGTGETETEAAAAADEITFSTLLPVEKTNRAVATQGLMHILALATKGFLRVRQDGYEDQSSADYGVKYEYGDIFVRLAEV